jgi:3-methyladenine DNA glycosylase/8-oxoguanine DNA glycosylase
MFRLDDDLREFHRECRASDRLRWVARLGLGRFLRNPSLFEEFVKVLLTTNVNWAGTKQMTARLIDAFGEPVRARRGSDPKASDPVSEARDRDELRAFPAPEALAGTTESVLRSRCRLGYRAPYLLTFADDVASGRLSLEPFEDLSVDTPTLARELGLIKGFGPYAVNALLMSLGRFERIILDSWIRKMVARRYFKNPMVSDRSIERVYKPWGKWKALACWFDCAHESWLKAEIEKEIAR